jgi:hypothetical protein
MKKLLLLLIVFPTIAHAQSISLDSLHREFERYLTGPKQPDIQIDGKTYQTIGLKFEPAPGSLLTDFAHDNYRVVEYIGTNFTALKDEYLYWHDSDSARFSKGKELPDSLWRNLYFERLTQLMDRYLQVKEHRSVDGIELNTRPKLSFAYLQDYTAKFYYPDSIQPNGGIRTHICVGFNGYRDAAPPRNLMLEAVAYSVANEHTMIPHDPIMEELSNAITAAESLNLSDDYDVKLLRAQGVVWGIMSQDAFLEKAIRDMYAEKKDWLTFELH